MKCYTYLFSTSVLKVDGELHTPSFITAKPTVPLGLVPTPISVWPILWNRIMKSWSQCGDAHGHYRLLACCAVSINGQVQGMPQTWKNEGTAPLILKLVISMRLPLGSQWKSPSSTHWTGGWVDPTASKNATEKRKTPIPASNRTTIPWQPTLQPSHYICT